MTRFTTSIQQFDEKGEKSGWTYILIPQDIAEVLNPGSRKTFRVKGKIDAHAIKAVAVMPMGDGSFILPVNAQMRKAIGKRKGAMVHVSLAVDHAQPEIPAVLAVCLADESKAKTFFEQLPLSQRNYYSKWVVAVKSASLQAERIAQVIDALHLGYNFFHFMQYLKAKKIR
ncbi:MAG: DUF1905 domain-containing protein [Chitinophagaceae bacterium]|nr:DUF1905 domain-containing protein [Chitinophagaceae bacterium]